MSGIRVGTMIKGSENPAAAIVSLAPAGFESWSVIFWETVGEADLPRLADEILAAIGNINSASGEDHPTPDRLPPSMEPSFSGGSGLSLVSSLSIFGNPLRDDETGEEIRRSWRALIDASSLFAHSGDPIPLVSGFAGRTVGAGVESSIEPWKRLFSGLSDCAARAGTRLAFENCRMGDTWKTGKWNIAINPDAWELMFAAIPADILGLEWEPCHQVEALADPLVQLKAWAGKVFHIHGKDSRIDRSLLAERGLYGKRKFHTSCFPGNGDTDWAELFRMLKVSGYRGTVDIEGWNDDAWSGGREIEGQVRALGCLKAARGR